MREISVYLLNWERYRRAEASLLIALITAVFCQSNRGSSQQSYPEMNACAQAYPHFSDRRQCGIHDSKLLNGWICDPDNIISMSEVYVIDDTLRRVYSQKSQNCQCSSQVTTSSGGKQQKSKSKKACWYKFAFAFLRDLGPVVPTSKDSYMNDLCSNFSLLPQHLQANRRDNSINAETAFLYAQNYVRVVREKWAIGECGEDILVLTVQNPPKQLVSKSSKGALPSSTPVNGFLANFVIRIKFQMVFVSYGSHVVEQFGVVDTYTLPYAVEPLRRIVDEANSNLRNAYPLNKVLNNLVLRTVDALQRVERALKSHHPRSHVPMWAWAIFGACGITFIMMGLGMFLIRTRARRGYQRGKSGNVDPAMRRWKAGFVGEDVQSQSQQKPNTYANLINIMMPHAKQAPSNMPQQV
ncbi:modulator of levamisole receptor-1 domain-containing protein [Ditylenchus destructor]|nr:modulator of levamisole receptor-1 domain-containing protein [Ditylenchus destructor]